MTWLRDSPEKVMFPRVLLPVLWRCQLKFYFNGDKLEIEGFAFNLSLYVSKNLRIVVP